jgi:acetylornithine deacetylase
MGSRRLIDDVSESAREEAPRILERMVSFRTDIEDHAAPPKDERAHQDYVANLLEECGAEVEVFEPRSDEVEDHPMYILGQDFDGRPIIWARLRGVGGGRSLLFNGHYDTVVPGPADAWSGDPWTALSGPDRIVGRGACDMKGGNAVAVSVLRAIARSGIRLKGDVIVNLVPFEEINGLGTIATVRRGYRADAAICCEPTELHPLLACRGLLNLKLSVKGRAAHAEIPQRPHPEGGGINAIDKLVDLLQVVRQVNAAWLAPPESRHPLLSPPEMVNTMLRGGEFWASLAADAEALFDITYLPADADETGYGARVREFIESELAAAAQADPWLRENPPTLEWTVDFPPVELDGNDPFAGLVRAVADTPFGGFDSWADQVTLVREGRIPTVMLGPGSIHDAHAVDESIELSSLRRCSEIYSRVAVEWCGVADG